MAEVFLRLQAAAGHEHIGHAHAGCLPERRPDVVLIIFFQERAVNDVKDVLTMLLPISCGKPGSDGFQLVRQRSGVQAVLFFQHGVDGVLIGVVDLPYKGTAGIIPPAGVGHVEHITDAGDVPVLIGQGDALGTAPDIPAHGVRP